MRVLYFSREYSPHDYRFLSSLAENHHQVYSLCLEKSARPLEEREPVPGVQILKWDSEKSQPGWNDTPALVHNLKKFIREIQPDILHAGPVQGPAFLGALTGFNPLVTMSYGSDLLHEANRNAWMKWVTRFTLRHSSILLGDCQAVKHKALEFGFPAHHVVLFPWGIDLDRFQPAANNEWRMRLGWQNDFIILSLRAWEPLYGVDVVIQGFIEACRSLSNLRLILLGDGSMENSIRERIAQAGLADRVHFGGRVSNPQLPAYYRAADLYISASHSDGSSVSLMEALACGKPVLVSDIPGNREWIKPGDQGWLFRDGDEHDLARRILDAAGRGLELKKMGESSRKLAEERADWKKNFQSLEQAYALAVDREGR